MDRSSGPKCYTNYLPLCVIRKSLVRQCFESLENKMSSGRFASLHEAELEQITDSRLSQNTKNATKYAVKTFLYFFLICQVNLNTAPNSCALYMQCIHGIVLLHLFVKKWIWGKCTRATIHEIQCNYKAKERHFCNGPGIYWKWYDKVN
jgi:hypothetical protein